MKSPTEKLVEVDKILAPVVTTIEDVRTDCGALFAPTNLERCTQTLRTAQAALLTSHHGILLKTPTPQCFPATQRVVEAINMLYLGYINMQGVLTHGNNRAVVHEIRTREIEPASYSLQNIKTKIERMILDGSCDY